MLFRKNIIFGIATARDLQTFVSIRSAETFAVFFLEIDRRSTRAWVVLETRSASGEVITDNRLNNNTSGVHGENCTQRNQANDDTSIQVLPQSNHRNGWHVADIYIHEKYYKCVFLPILISPAFGRWPSKTNENTHASFRYLYCVSNWC